MFARQVHPFIFFFVVENTVLGLINLVQLLAGDYLKVTACVHKPTITKGISHVQATHSIVTVEKREHRYVRLVIEAYYVLGYLLMLYVIMEGPGIAMCDLIKN